MNDHSLQMTAVRLSYVSHLLILAGIMVLSYRYVVRFRRPLYFLLRFRRPTATVSFRALRHFLLMCCVFVIQHAGSSTAERGKVFLGPTPFGVRHRSKMFAVDSKMVDSKTDHLNLGSSPLSSTWRKMTEWGWYRAREDGLPGPSVALDGPAFKCIYSLYTTQCRRVDGRCRLGDDVPWSCERCSCSRPVDTTLQPMHTLLHTYIHTYIFICSKLDKAMTKCKYNKWACLLYTSPSPRD